VLSLYEPDGRTRHVHLGLSRAAREPAHFQRLFAERLDGLDAAFGFDAMTLAATATETLDARQADFDARPRDGAGASAVASDEEALARLTDRLANRLGAANVLRLVARESRIPERAAVAVSALASPGESRSAPFAPPGAPARPLRLLPRPEPVEAVALLPHDPPALFRWRRVAHRVARAEGPERIAPEWWRGPGDEERDYWRIEDERGHRFWLYRAGLGWYLHGVYG
jgi:protein ImuB